MATADFVAAAAAARLVLAGEKNSERESRRVNARGSGKVTLRFSCLIPCSAAAWAQPRRTNATWPRAVAGRHCNRELQFEIS